MITLDELTLPDELWWEDETDWTPVEQAVEYSTTGSLLIDLATKLAGRPITLVGDESTAWITRATMLALQAFAAVPGKQMTLVIHGQTFTAMFRYDDKKPVDAAPVLRITPPEAGDYYILRAVKLMAV